MIFNLKIYRLKEKIFKINFRSGRKGTGLHVNSYLRSNGRFMQNHQWDISRNQVQLEGVIYTGFRAIRSTLNEETSLAIDAKTLYANGKLVVIGERLYR